MIVGVGVDVVDIDRFRTALDRTPRLVERVFTDTERADLDARNDPVPGFAARFAAKEAVMKALGVGLGAVDLADIGVVRQESGAPVLSLVGRARSRADDLGAHRWHVSLSHSDLIAQAFVVASSSGESAPLKTP